MIKGGFGKVNREETGTRRLWSRVVIHQFHHRKWGVGAATDPCSLTSFTQLWPVSEEGISIQCKIALMVLEKRCKCSPQVLARTLFNPIGRQKINNSINLRLFEVPTGGQNLLSLCVRL